MNLITIAEAAAILAVSVTTVRKKIGSGDLILRAQKIARGHGFLVAEADVQALKPDATPIPDDYIRLTEAAALLGVSRQAMSKMIQVYAVPQIKPNARTLYLQRSAVERLKKRTRRSGRPVN